MGGLDQTSERVDRSAVIGLMRHGVDTTRSGTVPCGRHPGGLLYNRRRRGGWSVQVRAGSCINKSMERNRRQTWRADPRTLASTVTRHERTQNTDTNTHTLPYVRVYAVLPGSIIATNM